MIGVVAGTESRVCHNTDMTKSVASTVDEFVSGQAQLHPQSTGKLSVFLRLRCELPGRSGHAQ